MSHGEMSWLPSNHLIRSNHRIESDSTRYCTELSCACACVEAKVNAYADVSWWDESIAIKSSDQIESSNRIRLNKRNCIGLSCVCAHVEAKAIAWTDVSWWDELIAIKSSYQIESSNRIRLNKILHRALMCLRLRWSESNCICWCLMMRWVDCHRITPSDRIIESDSTKVTA